MNFPNMPDRIRRLPLDSRGFPVPWFVHWESDEPDFRVIGPGKLAKAFKTPCCWICGDRLGVHRIYCLGAMCVVTRTTAEPASHRDCAEFAARACPFLTKPRMRRNEKDLPEESQAPAGIHLDRNPGCVCLYETQSVQPFRAGDGWLFKLGAPTRVDWWAEGRKATREEVLASIDSGYPILLDMAKREGPDAVAALLRMRDVAMNYLPSAVAA